MCKARHVSAAGRAQGKPTGSPLLQGGYPVCLPRTLLHTLPPCIRRSLDSAFSFQMDPSSYTSRFQIGTVALSSSIAQAQACRSQWAAYKQGLHAGMNCIAEQQGPFQGWNSSSLSADEHLCTYCFQQCCLTSRASLRCAEDIAMITLASPIGQTPVLCATATRLICQRIMAVWQSSCRASTGCVAQQQLI